MQKFAVSSRICTKIKNFSDSFQKTPPAKRFTLSSVFEKLVEKVEIVERSTISTFST
jgi:hypothetical protein